MRGSSRTILYCLFTLVFLSGCIRQVTVPAPDIKEAIVATLETTDLPPEVRADVIDKILKTVTEMYKEALLRASEKGKNIKEVLLDVLTVAAALYSAGRITR